MRTLVDKKINNKSIIGGLIKKLSNKNGIERRNTRKLLVSIGEPVLSYLEELVPSKDLTTRWEAIKTIGQINVPKGIPLLLTALNDEEFEIRWLAAEGLINLGIISLVPLLEALIVNYQSVFFRLGTHHVLSEFKKRDIYVDPANLLSLMNDYVREPTIPLEAKKELDRLKPLHKD